MSKKESNLQCIVKPLLLSGYLVLTWLLSRHDTVEFMLRLQLIPLILYMAGVLFHSLVIHADKMRDLAQKLFLVLYSLFCIACVLELIFMFVPRSHGFGQSKATCIWHKYYNTPCNQNGYRDLDINPQDKSRKSIIVVGDSFTFGSGINHIRDRFSDKLGVMVKKEYRVYNLGKNGSDTRDEYERLLMYPIRPDILILQYFINDIQETATVMGKSFPDPFFPFMHLNWFSKFFVLHSYLINFVYWQFPHGDSTSYLDALAVAYGDMEVFSVHREELHRFIEYSAENSVPLIVVLFPLMEDLDASEPCVRSVECYFKSFNVPCVDVAGISRSIPKSERMVNKCDGHASVSVNTLVAGELYHLLKERNLIHP